ncbi:hypothetical protein DEU56DRAFT_230434 [Suillus clintonianus]|uniref:uncharacterized protein n=1 Tax=Suillus clintonianus TaxID=1904413 RepID=UPI001B8852A9|nr:uncharacterized protein DEU56DRAFT_230434 [Suillus clintonianus]KAG2156336.1 hypothetical protein DEU56DRAFT_230434 [Suillus clintonianus]
MVFAQNNVTSRRKRPMCHKCLSTMAGHTRKNNIFVCPGSAERTTQLLSPDTPPPTYEFHGFQVPPGDRWHWRNPNWVSPPRERPHEKTHSYVSLTPTEPLSEGESGKENISPFTVEDSPTPSYSDDDWVGSSDPLYHYPNFSIKEESPEPQSDAYISDYSNTPPPREWSPFSQSPITDISLNTALRAGTPLYSVYRVPRQDVPKVQRTAQREGKLLSVMTAPPAHLAKIPREKSQETVWVILSDREEDLRYAVHSQRMPGAFAQDTAVNSVDFSVPKSNAAAPIMQNAPFCDTVDQTAQHVMRNTTFDQSMYSIPGGMAVQQPLRTAGLGFLQMAFAGIIGGLVVTYGRALL